MASKLNGTFRSSLFISIEPSIYVEFILQLVKIRENLSSSILGFYYIFIL